MFNRPHNHQRRLDAAHRTRPPRLRRLTVEAMESRLLLSGNQLTGGEIDHSIWNLDSIGSNSYVVISPGDGAAPPTISTSGATATDDSPPLDYNLPWVVRSDFVGPNSLDVGPAIGGSHGLLVAWDNDTPGAMTAVFANSSAMAIDTAQDGFLRLVDLHDLLELRTQDRDGIFNRIADDSVITFDSIGQNLSSNWLSIRSDVAAGLQPAGPGATANFLMIPSIETSLVHVSLVTPGAEHFAGKPAVNTPVAENFAQRDFASAFLTTNTPSASVNIDASQAESLLGPAAGNHAADADVTITVPDPVADAIAHVRQPTRDERLADAIDDLLSEETIILSTVGQSGTEYLASNSPTGLDAASNFHSSSQSDSELVIHAGQLADGGMIPIDVLVAAAGSDAESILVDAGTELAATDRSTGALGELSRAAVMELIEGEAEPGAAESADYVMVVAKRDADPLDAFRVVTRQAGVAFALAAPAGPTHLASITAVAVDAASRALATLVGNHLAAETTGELATTDAARHAAFSELGGAADEVESTAELDGLHWNRWLAATPLAVAIACERALAIRNKRRDERDPARPRTAK